MVVDGHLGFRRGGERADLKQRITCFTYRLGRRCDDTTLGESHNRTCSSHNFGAIFSVRGLVEVCNHAPTKQIFGTVLPQRRGLRADSVATATGALRTVAGFHDSSNHL